MNLLPRDKPLKNVTFRRLDACVDLTVTLLSRTIGSADDVSDGLWSEIERRSGKGEHAIPGGLPRIASGRHLRTHELEILLALKDSRVDPSAEARNWRLRGNCRFGDSGKCHCDG